MRAVYWVWRRDLHVMLRAPILYVVGGLFLVVQGVAFAGLVGQLSDPRKPAPLGALLEGQLAGTLLTWVLALVVLTLLGMRTIAEDKRSGAWELLLTAQVGEGAAVIGKWLAACTLYAVLWIPTLAYLALVAIYRGDSGGWDAGAIACGYVGAIAIGWALLAWSIAASAAMSSTLGAGGLGFALLVGLFLLGELPSLWPESSAGALEVVSVRVRAIEFARGEISASAIVFVVGLAVTGLSLAIVLACAGRRRMREVRTRALATLAIATIAACCLILAVRHPIRIDASARGRNTLDPATIGILGALSGPATLTIIRPSLGGIEPIYEEVARVAKRMAEHAPKLTVRWVDPAAAPGGLPTVAKVAGLQPNDLASSGAVIVELENRRRVVDFFTIAKVDAGPTGAPTVQQLAVERALAGALAALGHSRPITICSTTGHGELPMTPRIDKADWGLVAERLEGEGMKLEDVAIMVDVPSNCTVLVIAGPSSKLSPDEALAIQTYLKAGGALFVAAPTRTLDTDHRLGIESILANEGIGLPAAFAIDLSLLIREVAGALFVVDGYADHPINDGFAKTRATLWFQPRIVLAEKGATPLVSATKASWGETDLRTSPPARDGSDLEGPAAVAVLGRSGRVIAVGSAESLMTQIVGGGASALDLWLAQAIRFLAKVETPKIAARTPDQVRLVLSAGQRRMVIALSVAGIPLAWLVIGGALLLARRRKTRGAS